MHADSNVRRWGSVPGIKWLGFMELDFHDALNCCERGFRFLKDPLFFASSLFLKNPKRIMALLMVMLLSLLVYGIAGVWDC